MAITENGYVKRQSLRLLKDRYLWYIALLALFTGTFTYIATISNSGAYGNGETSHYVALYRLSYVAVVAIAAWRFGVKGGLFVCLALSPILISVIIVNQSLPNTWLEIGLIVVGIVISWLIGRQGEMKILLEQKTEDLRQQATRLSAEIDQRKQMEEQLILTDRLASIGELASGIAHELNNPLTGVIALSQLLVQKDVTEDIKEDLNLVYSEAQRAANIVKNLLTFARKHTPTKELLNINEVIGKVLELRAYEERLSNIEVITNLTPDLPQIMADYFQLQQVFLNIVINAEHFMIASHNSGTFTITTERTGDAVRASFADDGPGISKENLGHIFDPFFTTKEVGKGTGLGLSICHGIISAHSGQIYAEGEPGKGATFIVELPIYQEGQQDEGL